MPKWWNEQQVCGSYTRDAHTVGARTGEKGAHGKEGAHAGRAHGARTAMGARTWGAHGNGGVHSHGGACGKGRHEWPQGHARQEGARTSTGALTAKGRVHAYPLGWPRPPATWVAWAHTRAPIIGEQTGGAHGFKEGGLYMFCHPHLKLPSLLLLAPCLAPAKCFAWDFGG
jgi:hypothetical protein